VHAVIVGFVSVSCDLYHARKDMLGDGWRIDEFFHIEFIVVFFDCCNIFFLSSSKSSDPWSRVSKIDSLLPPASLEPEAKVGLI
jgi:hypothetical protein